MKVKKVEQLEYGTLLWMRPSRRFGIEVPLDILSDEQLESLKKYLAQEEKTPDVTNRSRIIWEYFYDVKFLVPVIELTKEQKKLLDPPKPKAPPKPYSYTNVDFIQLRDELIDSYSEADIAWKIQMKFAMLQKISQLGDVKKITEIAEKIYSESILVEQNKDRYKALIMAGKAYSLGGNNDKFNHCFTQGLQTAKTLGFAQVYDVVEAYLPYNNFANEEERILDISKLIQELTFDQEPP